MLIKLLYLIVIALEVIMIIHSIKSKRYLWTAIILFFSPISMIIYLAMYYIPEMKKGNIYSQVGKSVGSMVFVQQIVPNKELERLKNELEFSDTVRNKQNLAAEYMRLVKFQEAEDLYVSCLTGNYSDDPEMLLDLGKAQFYGGKYEMAIGTIEKIKLDPVYGNPLAYHYLARSYEEAGNTEMSLKYYEKIGDRCYGEETRCRYAMLLKKLGFNDKANEMFRAIAQDAKDVPQNYMREQKEWFDYAISNVE